MFKRKKKIASRFVTKDSSGTVELWSKKPTFHNLGHGFGCFLDDEHPENHISLESEFNANLVKQFLLPDTSCLEIELEVTKKGVSYRLVRAYNYKTNSY